MSHRNRMDNIKHLRTYLDSKEITALKVDIDFLPTIQGTFDFLDRIGKDEVINLLNQHEKEQIFRMIDDIHRNLENYVATKNNSFCLVVNHFLFQGYAIFFTQIKDFQAKFSGTLADLSQKTSKLTTDLQSRSKRFDDAIRNLDNSSQGWLWMCVGFVRPLAQPLTSFERWLPLPV